MDNSHMNWIGQVVGFFVKSKVTPLILGFAIFLGIMAVVNLPREEEPQISVPMFDIFVRYPGATSQEVEQRIINVGERKLWEISGVEYIYSTAQTDGALIVVRFKVGEDLEKSLTKLYTKVFANLDFLPQGASQPLIKVHSIDDVPILSLTFYSRAKDGRALRRIAASVQQEVNAIPDISQTQIIGGHKRRFQVLLDPMKMSEYLIDPAALERAIVSSNVKSPAGHLQTGPKMVTVETDGFFSSKEDLENLVVSSSSGNVVYLKDIARVIDGPDDEEHYVNIRFGIARGDADQEPLQAVTLAISKRKGSNAARLCEQVLKKIDVIKGNLIPEDVKFEVTRNYGETATEKSNELLIHMAIAVIGVAFLIALVLGWKEAGIVAVAIPVTLALTLASFYWLGFTLNRITLFALIFSIGILVDDPIVNVENIVRHLRLAQNRGRKFLDIVIGAVIEVQSPLILATLTVISAVLPMAFVGGLMGPYMRPIPIGSSLAMVFSMMAAFIATPWAATVILKRSFEKGTIKGHDTQEDFLTRVYRSYMKPLIYHSKARKNFFIIVGVLLGFAVLLVPLKGVKVKMLPFDNKNEFQVVLDMPEGSSLATTGEVIEKIARYLQAIPEVDNIEAYVGESAPYNFNGLVRHYYLRNGTHQADLQVNLLPKSKRHRQSHAIAKSVRGNIHEIVSSYGAHVQIAEVPPGPPVLSTLVMEVYGPEQSGRDTLAKQVEQVMSANSSVTDITTPTPASEKLLHLAIDHQKASLNGISSSAIAGIISTALAGKSVDLAHLSDEYEPVEIVLRLPEDKRKDLDHVLGITLLSSSGVPVPLKDLVKAENTLKEKPIFHKNLMRVNYVFGDVAGPFESPVYVIFDLQKSLQKLVLPTNPDNQRSLATFWTSLPTNENQWSLKFDGEWHITYEVFRDLGIAFAVVLILIYVLVVGWFQSFKVPLIIMMPIPLTLVGILPAHWLSGTFFTATSMIGMIAGAGIVVRNSIILVDFIQLRLKEGMPLEEAVIDAGAVRFRPMLLTAMAVVVGASVILFDPIFQGLAVSLMAGELASTVLSRTAIPVIYYVVMRPQQKKEA
ncbi:MAG: efflux RND transporter permease subunit [Candidatus Omnitrophica bacterium]|nr:efflux RND transporter permease subunit [Candidatus Omnitrophota bacterium]